MVALTLDRATERTSNACAEVLHILHHAHDLIHQNASNPAGSST